MSKTNLVIEYLGGNFPQGRELEKEQLEKLVYLTDWISSILQKKQFTDLEWSFGHSGPKSKNFFEEIEKDKNIVLEKQKERSGFLKEIIKIKAGTKERSFKESDKVILEYVLETTKGLDEEELNQLVYSSYPILVSTRGSKLDLVKLAGDFKEQIEEEKEAITS